MHEMICDACGQITAHHNIVYCKSEGRDYRPLCNRCVNAKVAHRAGLETFEDLQFQPVVLSRCPWRKPYLSFSHQFIRNRCRARRF